MQKSIFCCFCTKHSFTSTKFMNMLIFFYNYFCQGNKPFQKSSTQASSQPQSHYRLTMRDVPFVAGKVIWSHASSFLASRWAYDVLLSPWLAVGEHQPLRPSEHPIGSVAAEAVPAEHVRLKRPRARRSGAFGRLPFTSHRGGPVGAAAGANGWAATHDPVSGAARSSASAFASPVLSLVFVGREQDELARQLEDSVSDQERKELHREQERLLLKMERKGEQIHKLHKHRKQV